MSDAPSFRNWLASTANPLSAASEVARHFAYDALKAAFEAGQAYQLRLQQEERQRRRHEAQGGDNIFT